MNFWEQVFGQGFANAQQSGLGGTAASAQPQGRKVDEKLKQEMIIRRCWNICQQARAEGWLMRYGSRDGRWQFSFVRAGKEVRGAVAQKQQALVNATEALAPVLGIRN